MPEIGRVIRIKHSFYMGVPRAIAEAVGMRANDRMAIITDGRTIAAAKIPIHEIVNRAFLKQAIADEPEEVTESGRAGVHQRGRAVGARADGE